MARLTLPPNYTTVTRPAHDWNDPDGDGHTCVDCPPESIWKCDEYAHTHVVDPLEKIIAQHLPMKMEDGSIMCLCHGAHDGLFRGPAYHRRHVVGFIRAHLDGEHDPFTEGPWSDIDLDKED